MNAVNYVDIGGTIMKNKKYRRRVMMINNQWTVRFCYYVSLILCVNLVMGCSSMHNISWRPSDNSEKNNTRVLKNVYLIVKSPGGNPDSHYQLAKYYQIRGRHEEAINEFNKTVLIDPEYINAYNGMGVSFDMLGEYSMADESYQKALLLNSDSDHVLNNLGYSYVLQNKIDKAIMTFQHAIFVQGQEPRYYNNLAIAYAYNKQYDEAMDACNKGGDNIDVHYSIADSYYKQGLFAESKNHFEKIMDIDPSYKDAKTKWEAIEAMTRIAQEPETITEQEIAESLPATNTIEKEDTEIAVKDNTVPERYTANTDVEISNGNGINRMARRVGEFLRKNGINVTWLTNADNFNYQETNIFYRNGYLNSAMYIEKMLPGTQGYQESIISDRPENINVKVIIGRDLITHRDILELHKVPLFTTKTGKNNSHSSSEKVNQNTEHNETASEVEISNGNGVNSIAKKVASYLKRKGIKVTWITNADNFNHEKTEILYRKGNFESASHIENILPGDQNYEEAAIFDRPSNISIKVILGKDMVTYKNEFEIES
jgi:superkiller protein 3